MQGLWKPFLFFNGAAVALFTLTGRNVLLSAPTDLAILFGSTTALLAAVLWLCGAPARRFLDGMREAGARIQVVESHVGWWGDRMLVLETARGFWVLRTEIGRVPALYVRAPDAHEEVHVAGDRRRAGHHAAVQWLVVSSHTSSL